MDNKCYIFLNGFKNKFLPIYSVEPNLDDAKNFRDEILEILSLIDELKLNSPRIYGLASAKVSPKSTLIPAF